MQRGLQSKAVDRLVDYHRKRVDALVVAIRLRRGCRTQCAACGRLVALFLQPARNFNLLGFSVPQSQILDQRRVKFAVRDRHNLCGRVQFDQAGFKRADCVG